jgi:hypothetical protein
MAKKQGVRRSGYMNNLNQEQMVRGYKEMAAINLAIAKDFEPLENEAEEKILDNFKFFAQKGE